MLHQTVAKRFVERRKSSFIPTDCQMTIVILGACKVGKSTIVGQYLWHIFDEEYKPTIEEFHWVEYDRGRDTIFTLQVIDSSGSHDFLAMRQLYYRTGDAFIIVFSIDNENSYNEAKEIVTQLLEIHDDKTPIVLVANKNDKRARWKDKETHMFALRTDQLKEGLDLPQLSQLKKRRQSMPTCSHSSRVSLGDLEKLKQKQKGSCVIS